MKHYKAYENLIFYGKKFIPLCSREKNLKEILDMIVARERPMERVRVSSECPVR